MNLESVPSEKPLVPSKNVLSETRYLGIVMYHSAWSVQSSMETHLALETEKCLYPQKLPLSPQKLPLKRLHPPHWNLYLAQEEYIREEPLLSRSTQGSLCLLYSMDCGSLSPRE